MKPWTSVVRAVKISSLTLKQVTIIEKDADTIRNLGNEHQGEIVSCHAFEGIDMTEWFSRLGWADNGGYLRKYDTQWRKFSHYSGKFIYVYYEIE